MKKYLLPLCSLEFQSILTRRVQRGSHWRNGSVHDADKHYAGTRRFGGNSCYRNLVAWSLRSSTEATDYDNNYNGCADYNRGADHNGCTNHNNDDRGANHNYDNYDYYDYHHHYCAHHHNHNDCSTGGSAHSGSNDMSEHCNWAVQHEWVE